MAVGVLDDVAIELQLDQLMRETYTLWDEVWVGFSWRNYTYDHVTRVRRLAHTIGQSERAELRPLRFGALLHDITKSYDGEIMMRDGQRVLDEDGFWRNETLPPRRRNLVTDLYEQLGLHGQVHHISGGRIARAILDSHGFDHDFLSAVEEIIRSHLKVTDSSSEAGRSLYDADTMDANVGLPALYRNFQIVVHRQQQEYAKRGERFSDYLATNLREFLVPYVRERLPTWNSGKNADFVPRMTTDTARDIASDRISRLASELDEMSRELDDFESATQSGRLAVVKHLILSHDNPSLSRELDRVEPVVISATRSPNPASELIASYRAECAGLR